MNSLISRRRDPATRSTGLAFRLLVATAYVCVLLLLMMMLIARIVVVGG